MEGEDERKKHSSLSPLTSSRSSARHVRSCFNGTNSMSDGGRASYTKGGVRQLKSCVPMATSERCRHRLVCSRSCRSMRDA
jgi:hypothetical protein